MARHPRPTPTRNHLRDQPALHGRHPRPFPGRRRARGPREPGRGRGDEARQDGEPRDCRLAQHNGVAAIHSELLRTTTVRDLAEVFPDRFHNITNGVTPRRWLRLANPSLAQVISAAIGDSWIADLTQLRKLRPLVDDAALRAEFRKAERAAKASFADWLKTYSGIVVDPDTMFDCQVKRIHEYKRQLLNALRIVILYRRLRDNPNLVMPPRTFFFAGKAAAAYH